MNQKRQILSVVFKALTAAAATLGILLQCGFFSGKLDFSVLTYFTLMSNIGTAIYFTVAAIVEYRTGKAPLPALRGALQMCMTVTGVVYHMMLAGRFEMQGTLALSNTLLHYVCPICVNLNWLLFEQKGVFTWKMALVWELAPLAYSVFVYIAVACGAILGPYGQAYPYYFMDPSQVGGIGILLLVDLVMGIAFLVMGLAIVGLDRLLGRRTAAKHHS